MVAGTLLACTWLCVIGFTPAARAQSKDARGLLPGSAVASNAYREGFARGEVDARSGLSKSPARWSGAVPPAAIPQFVLGYNTGYDQLAAQAGRYHKEGMAHGSRDARAGAPKDPARYHAPIPREKRADFTRGYVEAYDREFAGAGPQFYQQGIAQGARDAKGGAPKDPARYHAPIPREKRADFTRGYVEAYDREFAGAGRQFYQRGLAVGAQEARAGAPKNPARHHAAIPREKRADFTRGYVEAYDIQFASRPPAPQNERTYEIMGARYAQLDQRAGLGASDSRHIAQVPRLFHASFLRGYRAAWRPQPR